MKKLYVANRDSRTGYSTLIPLEKAIIIEIDRSVTPVRRWEDARDAGKSVAGLLKAPDGEIANHQPAEGPAARETTPA